MLLVTGMIVGGAAGLIAGGIKVIRLISLTKGLLHRVIPAFYPVQLDRTPRVATEKDEATIDHSSSEFD